MHIERQNSLFYWETSTLLEIDVALRFYVSGCRCRNCLQRVDEAFSNWHDRAASQSLPLSPVYMLLCDGAFLKTIDQSFRRRNGWAKSVVRDALTLWPPLRAGQYRRERRAPERVSPPQQVERLQ